MIKMLYFSKRNVVLRTCAIILDKPDCFLCHTDYLINV